MKEGLRNAGLFFGIWIAVMIIYLVTHRVTDPEYMWKVSILPGAVLGAIALLGTLLERTFRVRKGINWMFLLVAVAVDQGIKAYLFSLSWETLSVPIIEPVFYLDPSQNTLGSYLWVLLNFDKGSHLFNILLFTVIAFFFVEIWRFYVRRKRNSFWINGFIHLFLAGVTANIIDNAFWGGSLDYITIRPFYTFDLKDMYITLCELFLLTELADNRLLRRFFHMPREDSKRLNRDFVAFIRNDLRSVFRRGKDKP